MSNPRCRYGWTDCRHADCGDALATAGAWSLGMLGSALGGPAGYAAARRDIAAWLREGPDYKPSLHDAADGLDRGLDVLAERNLLRRLKSYRRAESPK